MSDLKTIHEIAARAARLFDRVEPMTEKELRFLRKAIAAEVITVHVEIVPLRLAELLAADDMDFAHDVGGIHRHLDDRGAAPPRLTECFLPRFADV